MTIWQTASLILVVALALSAILSVAWRIQRRTGRSGWIDTIWSLAVGASGLTFALAPVEGAGGLTTRQSVIACLVLLWSLRLGLSIARRTSGAGEDPRYAQLEKEWGVAFGKRLFWFLQIQAAAALVLAVSIFAAAQNPQPMRSIDWAAAALLVVAIGGETIADEQLRRFKSDPANKGGICEEGLWAYSRHPNYFFEWLGWCAYPLFAIGLGFSHPWGLLSLAAPVLMYWLLVHASGIPHLEAHMERSRGATFEAYKRRVNAFVPGPRRAML